MNKDVKYQILKYSLAFLLLIFAFFLWRSIDRAIFVEGASVWKVPFVWSSLFFGVLALAILLIKERTVSLSAMAVSFLISFFYSYSTFHGLILLIAILLVLVAEGKMRDDFRERLKINLGKNIRAGSIFVVFAISLTIATQYYFETKDLATDKYLPRLEMDQRTSSLALKALSNFMPQAKDLGNPEMTVDQFLLGIYARQMGIGEASSPSVENSLIQEQLKKLDPTQRTLVEEKLKSAENNPALDEGRKQISKLALREVKGSEKIGDVFSEILNKKISGYFMPNIISHESSPLFSGIIALILFLTAVSLGSSLMFLWIWVIKIIFFTLRQSGMISVVLIPAEKEIVE